MYIELHEFRWEGDAITMLLDIFAARSPYTLRKRALALMHICDYLELHFGALLFRFLKGTCMHSFVTREIRGRHLRG